MHMQAQHHRVWLRESLLHNVILYVADKVVIQHISKSIKVTSPDHSGGLYDFKCHPVKS